AATARARTAGYQVPCRHESRTRFARNDGRAGRRIMSPIRTTRMRCLASGAALIAVVAGLSGCQWRGLNSMPMPGTQGAGPGSFEITAQMPDVAHIEPNSRVRVGDANIGTVTKIERNGWHALVTM